jgi:hypothetical protein
VRILKNGRVTKGRTASHSLVAKSVIEISAGASNDSIERIPVPACLVVLIDEASFDGCHVVLKCKKPVGGISLSVSDEIAASDSGVVLSGAEDSVSQASGAILHIECYSS